jgi:hypothetical protein
VARGPLSPYNPPDPNPFPENPMIALALLTTAFAHAAPEIKLENIKQIVCESVAYYEEDTPNETTPGRGVKIFVPGSRKDVRPKAGAFLLTEYDDAQQGGGLTFTDNQQYYFNPVKDGKLTFAFIADWKANGELTLGADNTATGWLNQKTHVTTLNCAVQLKQ